MYAYVSCICYYMYMLVYTKGIILKTRAAAEMKVTLIKKTE